MQVWFCAHLIANQPIRAFVDGIKKGNTSSYIATVDSYLFISVKYSDEEWQKKTRVDELDTTIQIVLCLSP